MDLKGIYKFIYISTSINAYQVLFLLYSYITRITQCFKRLIEKCKGSTVFKNISLRVHRFKFKWDLSFHLSVCLASLTPFAFTGQRLFAILPLSVWAFYNTLFLIGTSRANSIVPGFGRFKHAFTASIEEFFSTK